MIVGLHRVHEKCELEYFALKIGSLRGMRPMFNTAHAILSLMLILWEISVLDVFAFYILELRIPVYETMHV